MSLNYNYGWIKDENGVNYAPNTIIDKVLTPDGGTLADELSFIQNDIIVKNTESKTYTDNQIANEAALRETAINTVKSELTETIENVKSTSDTAVQKDSADYIKGISTEGTIITITKGDDSTATVDLQDDDDLITTEAASEVTGEAPELNPLAEQRISAVEDAIDKLEEKVNNSIGENYLVLKDSKTGNDYFITIDNGQINAQCKILSIEVTKLPDKIDYNKEESFDPTGMIVTATYVDGTTKEITNYSYPSIVESENIKIEYIQFNDIHSTTLIVNVIKSLEEQLIDFEYYITDDGKYYITGWKGTYNGEPSTECIIPDNNLISL